MRKEIMMVGGDNGVEWYRYIMAGDGALDHASPIRRGYQLAMVRLRGANIGVLVHPALWKLFLDHSEYASKFVCSLLDHYGPVCLPDDERYKCRGGCGRIFDRSLAIPPEGQLCLSCERQGVENGG